MLGARAERARTRRLSGTSIVRIPRDERGVLIARWAPGDRRPARTCGRCGPTRRRGEASRGVAAHSRRAAHRRSRPSIASAAAEGGLPEPELDVEIRDARRFGCCGITEVVYRESRTVVEIEGDHHRTDQKQWNRDIDKYAAYIAEGWEVVRLTSRHVRGKHPRAVASCGPCCFDAAGALRSRSGGTTRGNPHHDPA